MGDLILPLVVGLLDQLDEEVAPRELGEEAATFTVARRGLFNFEPGTDGLARRFPKVVNVIVAYRCLEDELIDNHVMHAAVDQEAYSFVEIDAILQIDKKIDQKVL